MEIIVCVLIGAIFIAAGIVLIVIGDRKKLKPETLFVFYFVLLHENDINKCKSLKSY